MSKPRYLTVVFAINDEDEFKDTKDMLYKKMLEDPKSDWYVSAMSLSDEVSRLEKIESIINNGTDLYEVQTDVNDIFSKIEVNDD